MANTSHKSINVCILNQLLPLQKCAWLQILLQCVRTQEKSKSDALFSPFNTK